MTLKTKILFSLFCVVLLSKGQQIKSIQDSIALEEFTIVSLGKEKPIEAIPYPVSLIKSTAANFHSLLSPADMFSLAPGVNVMRDGIWATSVNLRGLTDQRIVTLIDGIRLETATEIDGYLSMIDMNDIDQVEIIKSGASSLYGSGAMGGVLNIITKGAKYTPSFSHFVHAKSGYHSVNRMFESGAGISLSNKTSYIHLSGSYRTADNTNTPEGELLNSAFNDYNISLKAGIRTSENQELKFNLQNFSGWDIGFPGGSAFPGPAEVIFPKHARRLAAAEYILTDLSNHWTKSSFKAYYQYILRDVFVTVQQPAAVLNMTPKGVHHNVGASFINELEYNKHSLFTGIDFRSRYATSSREKIINYNNGNILIRGEQPLPNAQQSNLGIFAQDEIQIVKNRLNASLGFRVDMNTTANDAANDPTSLTMNGSNVPHTQRTTFNSDTIAVLSYGANVGMHYSPDQINHFSVTAGRSFRAASIEEKFKYIDLGSMVRIGDPKLKPETALTADIGYKYKSKYATASFNVFYHQISDMIVEIPGNVTLPLIDGTEDFVSVDALIGANVDRAVLKGFDGEFSATPLPHLTMMGDFSYVLGTNTTVSADSTIYLPLMPPFSATLRFRFSGKHISPELRYHYTANQTKVAEGETITDGYQTVDLIMSVKTLKFKGCAVNLTGGVQNLTNETYLNHLSSNRGLIRYEPGRNYFVKLNIEF